MKRKKEIVKYERVVSILEEVAFHVKFIYCLWIAKTVHLIPWIYILTENPFLECPFLLDWLDIGIDIYSSKNMG